MEQPEKSELLNQTEVSALLKSLVGQSVAKDANPFVVSMELTKEMSWFINVCRAVLPRGERDRITNFIKKRRPKALSNKNELIEYSKVLLEEVGFFALEDPIIKAAYNEAIKSQDEAILKSYKSGEANARELLKKASTKSTKSLTLVNGRDTITSGVIDLLLEKYG